MFDQNLRYGIEYNGKSIYLLPTLTQQVRGMTDFACVENPPAALQENGCRRRYPFAIDTTGKKTVCHSSTQGPQTLCASLRLTHIVPVLLAYYHLPNTPQSVPCTPRPSGNTSTSSGTPTSVSIFSFLILTSPCQPPSPHVRIYPTKVLPRVFRPSLQDRKAIARPIHAQPHHHSPPIPVAGVRNLLSTKPNFPRRSPPNLPQRRSGGGWPPDAVLPC